VHTISSRRLAWIAAVVLLLPSAVRGEPIVGAKNSKVYHTHPDDCGAAKTISTGNLITFADEQEARAAGRRRCKACIRVEQRAKAQAAEAGPSDEAPRTVVGKPKLADQRSDPPDEAIEPPPPAASAGMHVETVRVTKVLHGGTLVIDGGERLALLGVVVPVEGQPAAEAAKKFIRDRTRGRQCEIVIPGDLTAFDHRDALGRRRVFVRSTRDDGADVGTLLIAEGLAWTDRTWESPLRAAYDHAEEDAWWKSRGVWERQAGVAGDVPVTIGKYAFHYHAPDCTHVHHLTEAMTIPVNEAKSRRLVPCDRFHAP